MRNTRRKLKHLFGKEKQFNSYRKKFIYQNRKPDKSETEEDYTPCPHCHQRVPDYELLCPSCQLALPYCIVTVSFFDLKEFWEQMDVKCREHMLFGRIYAFVHHVISCNSFRLLK